jgi:hypothetical protein
VSYMSETDYFAGLAMQALVTSNTPDNRGDCLLTDREIAGYAYCLAAEMVNEKQRLASEHRKTLKK